jgi:hypothetical protein
MPGKRRSRHAGVAVITALQMPSARASSNERTVAHLRSAFDMSERQACRILKLRTDDGAVSFPPTERY